jgi:hypothetical protein
VQLVRDRDLDRTIARDYGSARAREIRTSLDPQCLSGFRKNENFEITHSDVILTVDNGDFVFLDCAYEELLQSLGPINDTSSVPWTMFNDKVSMGYFDVYDQYRLCAGIRVIVLARGSAEARLPQLPVPSSERKQRQVSAVKKYHLKE